ncbi:tRNA delta(2)-isopentenylpyrophosphate transferase [Methylobacterium sp. 4-46]|uniref:tRNA dimethylallyltransferase n=1 Tax=Methylobacterium sp. (strain 4-46) TaxID=426117 RepID=MIAA_METS4|nr:MULTISPECIES: tRNA (adenosine(37)-N6)-dimethylallyltransferase MiaA [Methylobacterium]B0UPN1.1 RecName: Full=tRNA dimethylallyltransferase; AltName: Full=Dimethylallyl diphosphate:tRNA dimethylallyltransferase; Short=DMAPP:tRNA dimethylallyltransferase; Short=DMATase; AltName: Full=Isopentenyl-diphosphate:tRNA isopentenyltransferase; Short=IPP transferase; Short=IPPT; Short=IPTase [Methylobacterium sp. 4-46]ACA20457.1 tRNA delta(2)-isopentenylpyrophosphate transferase [Methylobacterium sp. 4-4
MGTDGMAGRAILIAGPTASGKSALALALARARGGVVINADSMQVYADLRVLTARPNPAEEAQAPHRLYGSVDGAVNFSVGHYLAAVGEVLREVWAAGGLPIVVGGTGLYFKALLEGLSEIPPVPEAVRTALRAEAEGRETAALHADLARRDPEGAARLGAHDRLRVLRALEVLAATGRPLSAFQGSRRPGPLAGMPCDKLFLVPDRALLRARIDARFLAMMEEGALDEVARLRARRLDPMLPVMRAHGVPGLIAFLDGALTREEAVARGQADTRAYAKRQVTWFRHQAGAGWRWLAPEAAMREAGG